MRKGVFLQARLDSTRLANKVLYSLGESTVIEWAMHALRPLSCDVHALLCDANSREILGKLAERTGYKLFVGSTNNVLDRFAAAARYFGVGTIVRATGDNPFVSAHLAQLVLDMHDREQADYSAFNDIPLGTGVEVLSDRALFSADSNATESYEREHVSPYIYQHPGKFRICRVRAPLEFCMPEARVTLDTIEDYIYLRSLLAKRTAGTGVLAIRELLELLRMQD